ncbi:MAG: type II toxin-antitoxin system VapC family toxin [Deltaproteobacteria bacterium]|nr:type II toxin-antitoxin system VapC family toxin [Deltaproteobacteria bacterium]
MLLDTHAWLWLWTQPERLSRRAAAAIRGALRGGGIGVASISLWEVAMLIAAGKVRPYEPAERWIARLVRETGVVVRELTPAVATLATQFPASFPRDPADRIIAATARDAGTALVTADSRIAESPLVRAIW